MQWKNSDEHYYMKRCKLFPKEKTIDLTVTSFISDDKLRQIVIELMYLRAVELGYKYLTLTVTSVGNLRNWYIKRGFQITRKRECYKNTCVIYNLHKSI